MFLPARRGCHGPLGSQNKSFSLKYGKWLFQIILSTRGNVWLNIKLTFPPPLNALHDDFYYWREEKNSCFVTMTVACGLSNEKRKENMV